MWFVGWNCVENCGDGIRTLFVSVEMVIVVFVVTMIDLGHSHDKTVVV